MKIGVLSDSHINNPGLGYRFMETLARDYLNGVDMILHAGDIVDPFVLEAFSDVPVWAVRGNMDPPGTNLPLKRTITVGSFRIGLIHGWGPVEKLEQRVADEFAPDLPDCLVYGHSHLPACHKKEGVLFFNPGSPTDKRRAPYHTVGILDLDKKIRGRIIRLDA